MIRTHCDCLRLRSCVRTSLAYCRRVSGFRTVQVMKCDLGDLRSIRAFAKAFREKHGERLDVLVNNGKLSEAQCGCISTCTPK